MIPQPSDIPHLPKLILKDIFSLHWSIYSSNPVMSASHIYSSSNCIHQYASRVLLFDIDKKRHLYSQILHLRLDDLIFISKNILTSFHKSSWTFVLNDRCIFVQPFLLCINWRSYGFNCNFPFLCLCCYYNHVNHTFKISAWAAETNTVTHIIVASTTPSHVRKDNNEKDGMVSLISLSYNWMGFH